MGLLISAAGMLFRALLAQMPSRSAPQPRSTAPSRPCASSWKPTGSGYVLAIGCDPA
jgi:hypothetical protein